MIERVHGMDAAILSLEGGDNMLHVAQTCVFDPTRSSEPFSYGRIRQLIPDGLDLLPPFRKRLVPSPLGLSQPAWLEDPDVDLDADALGELTKVAA